MEYFEAASPLLPEILSLHGKWRAQQRAVSCNGQALSWRELTQQNHRIANGLLARQIRPNDSIGLVMSNGIPMLECMLGAMAAGITSVPINLSVNDDALLNMLADAQVKVLVLTSDQAARIAALSSRLPACIELIISDEVIRPDELLSDSSAHHPSSWITLNDLAAGQPTGLPAITIADSDHLNIIYSSGTTGMPKGIVHTQAGRRDWAYDLAIALRYHCHSKTLLTLGLYSNISWVAMLTTLLAGGSLVIHKTFDAEQVLNTISTAGITHTAMVPVQFQRVVEVLDQQPERFELDSMCSMMSCGSPLHAELKQSIFKHFACGVIELYGLTEGVITTLEPELAEGRWSSVGKPLIGTDICILSDDDQVLGANQSGEIASRGRITMPGYLNRPEANIASAYTDPQGRKWLRTGDVGYFDDQGFLYIVDRKKDMILSGSQNIYPQDIEAVLIENLAVLDVAVIAASSERWGETPVALVVQDQAHIASQEEILKWANSKLGKQQRIADVVFIDELPRNPNGKVLKRELRTTYSNLKYA